MRVIKASFQRIVETILPDLIEAVGVYVIWDGQARARPTYIGEGTILKRLADHSSRFAKPFDGYIAILGDTSSGTAKHEAEIVEAVVRRAACPVHLVGHSFGGLTVLAVALRNKVPLLSLTIAEAPGPEILRHTGEREHYRAFRDMSEAYFAAFHAGEEAAIEQMIDFYGGAGTFASWPQRVREYAVEATPVNILDWASAYGFELTPALLGTVKIPALVLWGEASHPAARRANELLGRYIPNALTLAIPGAAHFMIATHASDVAGAIARHVAGAEKFARIGCDGDLAI